MITKCPACGLDFDPAGATVDACPRCKSTITEILPHTGSKLGITPKTEDLKPTSDGSMPTEPRRNEKAAPLPEKIGRYRILGRAGAGGFGVVYKAQDEELNRTIALKVMIAGEHATEGTIFRFQREARSAARLSHPNIVHVYDVGQLEGAHAGTGVMYYFAMEFIEGMTLDGRIRERPPTPKEAAAIARDVAAALDYAHRQGIIHRDIKPGNILLDAAGKPHIADFGLAKAVAEDDSITRTGEIIGTACYMPPEQTSGRMKDVDAQSDIYSLGTVLYEMLTKRPPFAGETFVAILREVEERDPVPPSKIASVPRDINTICLKAMAKEKERRYATAGDFAEDLDRFIKDQPIAARSSGTFYRGMKWARRHPTTVTSSGLLVFFAVLLTWVILNGRIPIVPPGPPPPPPVDHGEARMKALREAQIHYRQASDDLSIANNTRRAEDRKRRRELFEKAHAQLDLALKIYPDYADAMFLRGVVRQRLNQPAKALQDFNRAIKLDPGLADAYFHRATLRLRTVVEKTIQGAPFLTEQDMAAAYPEEYRLVKEDVAALQRLASKPEKAIVAEVRWALVFRESLDTLGQLARAIQQNPTFADSYVLRALLNRRNADAIRSHDVKRSDELYTEALADCTTALSYEPNHEEALKIRAAVSIRLDRSEEAERDLEDMVSIAPGEAQTFLDRALVFMSGDSCIRWRPRVVQDLERAVELDPTHSCARFLRSAWILMKGQAAGIPEEVRRCRDEFDVLLVEQPNFQDALTLRLICDHALLDEASFEAHYNTFKSLRADLSEEQFTDTMLVVRVLGDKLRAGSPAGQIEGLFRDGERLLNAGTYPESEAKFRDVLARLNDPSTLAAEGILPARARELRTHGHYYLAFLHAFRQDLETAVTELGYAVASDAVRTGRLFCRHDLAALRGIPAFDKMAARLRQTQ